MKTTREYIGDNYGRCKLEHKCECLRTGWKKGATCKNWVPTGARSFEDLKKLSRAQYGYPGPGKGSSAKTST